MSLLKDKNNLAHNYISLYKYKKLKRENELLQMQIQWRDEFIKLVNLNNEFAMFLDTK